MKKLLIVPCLLVLLGLLTFGFTFSQPTTASADGHSAVPALSAIATPQTAEQKPVAKVKAASKATAPTAASQPAPTQPAAAQPSPTPEPAPVACTNNYPDPSCTKPEEPGLTADPMPVACTNSYPEQSCTY